MIHHHHEKFVAACGILYSSNNVGAQRKEAEHWIMEFQKMSEAWNICDHILRDTNADLSVQFLAAKTLHVKIRYDYTTQLNPESRVLLRDNLLEKLAVYAKVSNRQAVATQLALAIATLAIQMTEWHNSIRDLANKFGADPTYATCLIELLQMIPEELDSSSDMLVLSKERKNLLRAEMFDCCKDVIQYLEYCVRLGNGQISVIMLVLKCLRSWVSIVRIPGTVLSASNFIKILYDQIVNVSESFDTAIGVLISIVYEYNNPGNQDHLVLVQMLVPLVFELRAVYIRAVEEEDNEIAEGLARLFSSMSDSYIPILLDDANMDQVNLLQLPLLVTENPSFEVAMVSWYFWINFFEQMDRIEDSALFSKKCDQFGAINQQLCHNCLMRMMIPQEYASKHTDSRHDIEEEFSRNRKDIEEVFNAMCVVYQPTVLWSILQGATNHAMQELASSLQSQSQNLPWREVEACLTAFSCIADICERSMQPEAMWSVVEPLIQNCLAIPHINCYLREAITELFGRFSFLVQYSPQYHEPLMVYLLESFEKYPSISVETTRTITHLTKQGCNFWFAAEKIFTVAYSEHAKISTDERLDLIQSVAYCVSDLDFEEQAQAFFSLSSMPRQILERAAAEIQNGSCSASKDALEFALRSIEMLFRYGWDGHSVDQHPGLELFNQFWDILQRLTIGFCRVSAMAERCVTFLKICVRNLGYRIESKLGDIVQLIVHCFEQSAGSPFLYLGGIIIQEFHRKRELEPMFEQALYALAKKSMEVLCSFDAMSHHPDLVEDFFNMLGRNIRENPHLLIYKDYFAPCIQCAVSGILIERRETGEMISLFLEDLLMFCEDSRKDPTMRNAVCTLIDMNLTVIVENVVVGVSGALPTSRIAFNQTGSVSIILYGVEGYLESKSSNAADGAAFRHLIVSALQSARCAHLTDELRHWFVENIVPAAISRSKSRFEDVLLDFNKRAKMRLTREVKDGLK